MKKVTILIVIFIIPLVTLGQVKKFEYTPKVKNRVEIVNLLGEISLKNASGNTITVESDFNLEKPDRAEGLQLMGASIDNTELGVNISEENGVVRISGATKKVREYKYTISVPIGIAVSIDYHSPFASGDLVFESYDGILEIETLSANIKLTNCTGPFTVNSVSGDVEAIFSSINQDQPTSLASVSGLIDVTVPTSLKATINLSNITGDVYNNLNLISTSKEEDDKRSKGLDELKYNNGGEYTLNGGGQKLLLNTVSGNIYLRKK